jgi:hypothetical protein
VEEQDLLQLTLPGYLLGSSFSQQNLRKGGVCILFEKICISVKLISHITKEKDLEICAVELETKASKLIIKFVESTCRRF